MRRALALAVLVSALWVSGGRAEPSQAPPTARATDVAQEELPRGNDTFVQPNVRLPDGRLGYVHVGPEHMPWRVSVGKPKRPPKYAGSRKTREVAIEAMRMWEEAIQPLVPWFELEFVEDDPSAPVQIKWKRKITGPWAGFGRIDYRNIDGRAWVGGSMDISTTPSNFSMLTIDQVRLLVAHEFGHVLGLGHCLDCDSAMNYSWSTRGRVLVTELDARTFSELAKIPIGSPAE